MAEYIFDLDKDQLSFRSWALLQMMTVAQSKSDANVVDLFAYNKESKIVNLEASINGVEVDFISLIDRLESEMNYMVENKAKELLKEKIGNMQVIIDEITSELKRVAIEKLNLSGDF